MKSSTTFSEIESANRWLSDRDVAFREALLMKTDDFTASTVGSKVATRLDDDRYDEQRKEQRQWERYVSRCSRNAVIDVFRKEEQQRRIEIRLHDDPVYVSPPTDPTADAALRYDARRVLIDAANEVLTNRERECLILHYFHEMIVTEIADELGVHHSTVGRTLAKSVTKLRDHLHVHMGVLVV